MEPRSNLRVLIPRQDIAAAVDTLAAAITRDYHDKNPLVLCLLKGSFIFTSDLVRRLYFPLEVDFLRLSSYGSGKESSGSVDITLHLPEGFGGRHVLIVEDIIDSGITLSFLLDYLADKEPASLRLCALLDKPARRQREVHVDYLGLTVSDEFLVGYGLDCDEKYRNLPDICILE